MGRFPMNGFLDSKPRYESAFAGFLDNLPKKKKKYGSADEEVISMVEKAMKRLAKGYQTVINQQKEEIVMLRKRLRKAKQATKDLEYRFIDKDTVFRNVKHPKIGK